MTTNVDHGSRTGIGLKPKSFGNNTRSNATILRCCITLQSCKGMWGYSLKLNGLESDKYSNAIKSNIVVHSFKRMYSKFSLGCFFVPDHNTNTLIDLIKDDSLVYADQ